MLGEILSFAGPLIGEVVGLIGRYAASNAADKAAILAQAEAAMVEMRAAGKAEKAAHDALTVETRKVIDNAATDLLKP